MKRKPREGCQHPPARHYAGSCYDPGTNKNELWVACCDCGELLKEAYSAETYRLAAESAESLA